MKAGSGSGSGSPGVSPVELSDCLEHLLHFVLQSTINGTLDFNLGLSADFCSTLLKHDDFDHPFHHQNLPASTSKLNCIFLFLWVTNFLYYHNCSNFFSCSWVLEFRSSNCRSMSLEYLIFQRVFFFLGGLIHRKYFTQSNFINRLLFNCNEMG